ncbi:MAG: hypothetical protein PVI00_04465 [Desulfobacterales bacterium]|jgi:hypothetical protein
MKINIVTTNELLPRFLKLLGQGFFVKTQVGCSIKDLLCKQLQIKEEYLDRRIQTLFLNGKAVDDVERAYLQDDATLALSAAMPGLVGATFRKGGTFAPMRNTISYDAGISIKGEGDTWAKLKLFNMVLKELGPIFLANGVWIHNDNFNEFVARYFAEIKTACSLFQLDGENVDISKLENMNWKSSNVFLLVTAEEES